MKFEYYIFIIIARIQLLACNKTVNRILTPKIRTTKYCLHWTVFPIIILILGCSSKKPAIIKGTVTDESGVPKSGAVVNTTPQRYSTITDTLGHFIIVGVEPGKYSLMARSGNDSAFSNLGMIDSGMTVVARVIFFSKNKHFPLQQVEEKRYDSSKQDRLTYSKSNAVDDITIHSWAKKYVKNQLVSPSTARFPKYYEAKIIGEGDDIYEVYSYVDSENRFGAITRLYYGCTIEVSPNGMSATVLSFAWIQR